ncbi:MAG: cryptochrome/photolyase family protein [Gemmatimonadales bacterium]|nr:cryptochrome/photolyase family protein [Gemmatimonadales bacterium]
MITHLILPWDLSSATAMLPAVGEGRILFLDSPSKGTALPFHRKKLILVLSASRHFEQELREAGHEVHRRMGTSYAEGIRDWLREHPDDQVVVQQPAEWGIAQSIGALAGEDPRVTIVADRRFLVSREEFAAWANGRKLLRMEDFYRLQRKRFGLLMEPDGTPAGGQWNLDADNQKSAKALLKRGLPAPPLSFPPDAITAEVLQYVEGRQAPQWGSAEGFGFPVTRAQALEALDDFLLHRLADFGPYEDAMLHGEPTLYHSQLSVAMNIGLLHPLEMARAAEAAWRRGEVPLQSAEGFIRQVIGWREYVNGIYWLKMPDYRRVNYFGFTRPLPQLYWEPEQTDLACLRDTVSLVQQHAFVHHIPRLMILCNFAVLTGVNPGALSDWFWAAFADAMEWVELPNVVGMGTFGDGGLMASKPYVSSASYINRMSDHCGGCRYDPTLRTGPTACPFNYLYWSFLDDIRQGTLDVGQRMALVLKALERVPPAELAAMREERERFVAGLVPDRMGWVVRHDQG